MSEINKKQRNSKYFAEKAKEYRRRQYLILDQKKRENLILYNELYLQIFSNPKLNSTERE